MPATSGWIRTVIRLKHPSLRIQAPNANVGKLCRLWHEVEYSPDEPVDLQTEASDPRASNRVHVKIS